MHPELRSSSTGEALSHSAEACELVRIPCFIRLLTMRSSFLVWPTDEAR